MIVVAWLVESAVVRLVSEGLRELQDRLGQPPAPARLSTTYLYISSIVFLVGAQLDEFLRENATGNRDRPRQASTRQAFS